MKLLEDFDVELDMSEWDQIRDQLTKEENDAIWRIFWHGPFERTGHIRFNAKQHAVLFILKHSL